MKCLNCGYCCIDLAVVIIKPECVKTDLDLSLIDCLDENFLTLKNSNEMCPHIIIHNEKITCSLHDYTWYKDTPCYYYTQIENSKESLCRMGDVVCNVNKCNNYFQYKQKIKEKQNGN